MKIEFDPAKSARNEVERGLPFSAAAAFDFATALYAEDKRFDYPETRIIAVGFIDSRLHVLCFTAIAGGIRVISLRKANRREIRDHAQKTADE
ncbi:BrnT family toxin [Niveispirillum sp. KHB5.9]|uniref:BrnT family toxin n=1 Tax=Niveispirillum sp. KHB5.9 TaxID=3400269 RepID=UPI003A8352D5